MPNRPSQASFGRLRPLLTAHGMPVVPLAAALGQRGELHPGGGDCSHWCHASEASLHMARATLNVLAALL